MLNWKLLISSLMVALCQTPAFAGGADGGGGGIGVRCSGQLELLDRHEARFDGTKIVHVPETGEQAIQLVAALLGRHFWTPETIKSYAPYLAKSMIEPFFNLESFVEPGSGRMITFAKVAELSLSDDVGSYEIKSGCGLEQIIYFDDASLQIKVVESRWAELSWLDKAMLTAHELSYFFNRRGGLELLASNVRTLQATQTRIFVRRLFSELPPRAHAQGLPQDALRCQSAHYDDATFTKFYVFRSGKRTVGAFFNLLGGMGFYQLRADLQIDEPKSLLDPQADVDSQLKVSVREGGLLDLKLKRDYGQPLTLEVSRSGEGHAIAAPVELKCEFLD